MRWTNCCGLLVVLSLVAVAQSADLPREAGDPFMKTAVGIFWPKFGPAKVRTPGARLTGCWWPIRDPRLEHTVLRARLERGSPPGAAVEARVKVAACSGPKGVALLAADGFHEEWLTLYPHRLQLENAKQGVDFDAADGFHTYRLEIRGTDVRLFVDGKMLVDGKGKFTAPAQGKPPRNQCGFGCGSSPATGEAIWQWVRCQSDGLPRRTGDRRDRRP